MIKCWPSNNEEGAVFLKNEIVFRDNQEIFTLETTPDDLKERVDAYTHIRFQNCVGEIMMIIIQLTIIANKYMKDMRKFI
jgi:hypothetical protein